MTLKLLRALARITPDAPPAPPAPPTQAERDAAYDEVMARRYAARLDAFRSDKS
jgi:hypothetical protein